MKLLLEADTFSKSGQLNRPDFGEFVKIGTI